jgi:hypothetical protein
MDQVNRLLAALLNLLSALLDAGLGVFASFDAWLRVQMTMLGLDASSQTLILVVLAFAFLVMVIRLLGGLVRIILVLLLLLMLVELLRPIVG